MTTPTPPEGYTLHRQTLRDGKHAEMQPHIPVSALGSLLVYNGWQDRWEKPAYIYFGDSCWYACKEPT